jgi:methyl-accepting chemotaxis protein PixJ
MTQTSPKHTPQNAKNVNDSSSQTVRDEARTPATDYSSSPPSLSSPAAEAKVTQPLAQQGRERTGAEVKSSFLSLFDRLRRGWEDFNFRTKLTLLLVVGAALPVIAATQGIVTIAQAQSIRSLEEILRKELIILEEEIDAQEEIIEANANTLAKSVEAMSLDVSNPDQVSAIGSRLQSFLAQTKQENPARSFYLITDVQGKTVAQDIQVVEGDFSVSPPLPTEGRIETKFRPVSLAPGIQLGDIPIVKNALNSGRPLAGFELLEGDFWQRLGLGEQANIGLRPQEVKSLPEPKQPFDEGTYDIDYGKAGLVIMAVQPILVQGKLVGTAIVGNLINRNYEIVDNLKTETGVSTATIFARDWRVSTNVPYTDKKTRAIGTRVSREVAQKVLNEKKEFIGAANIIGIEYTTGYSPIYDHQYKLNPDQAKPIGIAYVGEPQTEVQKTLRNIAWTGYGIGGGILLLTGLVAVPVAGTFSNPLRRLAGFAQEVGAGKKGARLEASNRRDEIGLLSQEMNQMVITLEANEELLRQEAEQSRLLGEITSSRALDRQEVENIFQQVLKKARQLLSTERMVIYRFNPDWSGYISHESVASGWPIALNNRIEDACIPQQMREAYLQDRIVPTSDVFKAGFHPDHLKLMERLQIKANLVVPVLNQGQLFGLLIAHQCSDTRQWTESEISFMRQMAAQLGTILDRVTFLEQVEQARQQAEKLAQEQRQIKEGLQKRALELLMEVDPVTQGDLTIRASVTEDEIGTIADSYNATIESLRKIVTQVQAAAEQVAATTSQDEVSIRSLSAEALQQSEEIAAALQQIQIMADSIRAIAANAEQADKVVQQATQTVEAGGEAMNRTVEGFMAIRETVAETAKKVKLLGESSQKISKVVNLIGSFADQTNLLALNASIEAAHAGEEGRGFAVVAEEVRSLAAQSAEATAEIEALVAEIQSGTNEVVAAMEAGTEQVVSGTQLVEETRKNLNQIAAASAQIEQLVEAIAQAAIQQSHTSEAIAKTMTDVAAISDKTSQEATEVSDSFKQLLSVAQAMQESVGQFKVK